MEKNEWNSHYLTSTNFSSYRLKRGTVFMSDMIGSLNWRNITTIGTLSVGLPFPYGANTLPKLTGKQSPLLDLSSRKLDEVGFNCKSGEHSGSSLRDLVLISPLRYLIGRSSFFTVCGSAWARNEAVWALCQRVRITSRTKTWMWFYDLVLLTFSFG